MKINNKIFALLIVLIAIVSMSAVSANEDIADDAVSASADEAVAVEAVDSGSDVLKASHDVAANATFDEIQAILDNTSAGDTINFAENAVYDLNSTEQLKIGHTLIIQGNNATIKSVQGFYVQSDSESVAGTQFYNLNFIMTSTTWQGRAIQTSGGGDYIIANCTFLNGNAQVYIQRSTGNVTITNNYFKGVNATKTDTIGTSGETGTKAINMMAGTGVTITNNVFEGDLLDGISLAQGAANILMVNNTHINNVYGIFYGGGITNITMYDNVYIGSVVQAIAIKKAAGNTEMYNNTFITPENGTAIYLQEGNTAHGSPSVIETILIYNNTFTSADGADPSTTSILNIISSGGMINPKQLTVENNTYEKGTNVVKYDNNDVNDTYTFITDSLVLTNRNVSIQNNYYLLPADFAFDENTEFEFGDIYKIQLIGDDNVILADQDVTITITTGTVVVDTINATTNQFGIVEVPLVYDGGDYNITATYAGSDKVIYNGVFLGADGNSSLSLNGLSVVIISEDISVKTKIGQRFEVLLKGEDGAPLANETVTFTISGIDYNRTSNAFGVAGLNINLFSGVYNVTTKYRNYTQTNTLTVDKSLTQILAPTTTFTSRGNYYVAKLVDENTKPIANQKITFDINGVKYTRTTNATGDAQLRINLNRGTYYIIASYDGDVRYGSTTAGAKITTNY